MVENVEDVQARFNLVTFFNLDRPSDLHVEIEKVVEWPRIGQRHLWNRPDDRPERSQLSLGEETCGD